MRNVQQSSARKIGVRNGGVKRGEGGSRRRGEEGGFGDKMAALTSTSRMRCMYIFNRNGVCLHYHVWLRPHTTLSQQQYQKLMFGLLFSLKSFTAKMDPLGLAPIPSHPLPSAFLQTRRLSFCITGGLECASDVAVNLIFVL